MKIKILAFLILFSCIMFSGCDYFSISLHTAAEISAIEKCKNACKSPSSFKLTEIQSHPVDHSAEWEYDTIYFYKGEERLRSSERGMDYSIYSGYYRHESDGLLYFPKYVEYDSISIIKTGHDAYTDITIRVEFTAKNLFGVELPETAYFYADDYHDSRVFFGFSDRKEEVYVKSESFERPKKTLNTKSGYYDVSFLYD